MMLSDFEMVEIEGEKMNIGKTIKELRKFNGLSQTELSQGLCTQAQISKLENGTETPSSELLYFLSQRLGVDMNYFFDIKGTPRLDYVIEVQNQLRKNIRNRDYQRYIFQYSSVDIAND
jgi:transcriptional regulator with XRE-family HTH domain